MNNIRNIIISAAMLYASSALGQTNWQIESHGDNFKQSQNRQQYSFRASLPPSTNVLAPKGQLRVEAERQLYLGSYPEQNNPTKLAVFDGLIFRNWLLVADSRLGLSYTPWDNITIGAAWIASRKFDLQAINKLPEWQLSGQRNHLVIQYDIRIDMLELSGSYHRLAGEWWAWEGRTTLSLGRGNHIYNRTFNYGEPDIYGLNLYNDELRYNLFNHSLEGAVSVFTKRKRLQLTLLVNAGYTLYFNARGTIIQAQVYEQLASVLNRRRATLYMDPALVLNLNCRRVFSFQTHVGFPMGLGESELRTFVPTIGLGMSFRILGQREL